MSKDQIGVHGFCDICGEPWTINGLCQKHQPTKPNTELEGSSLTEPDIELYMGLEALAYVPRKKGEPATFDLPELRSWIAQLITQEKIRLLEKLSDDIFDDGRVDWGEPTKESKEEWGENHADLIIPTRYIHDHINNHIATFKSELKDK